MNKIITFLAASVCIIFVSCGKSDQDKAKEFIQTLNKESDVLLTLPTSAPKCVYFTQDNVILCHNVENDSTITIPYGDLIEENAVKNILAGDSNITVITKENNEDVEQVFLYDVGKQKFSQIKPFKNVTEIKLSKSNKTITFSYDVSNDSSVLDWSEYEDNKYFDKYLKKTAYNIIIKYYNYDGKLVKTKKKPVSIKEYIAKVEEAEENAGDDNNDSESYNYNAVEENNAHSTSPAVYLWRCMKCEEEREGVDEPDPHGCPWNAHMWEKVSRIR